jgi:cell division protein FtsL
VSYSTRTTQFTSRRQSSWNRNQNQARFVSPVKLGPVTHTVFVALMITVLGLIYLTQAASATNYDYDIQDVDAKIAELTNEKADLEIENARLTALETIKNSSVARQMTAPAETNYYNQ